MTIFDGKGDARGILARFRTSLTRSSRKKSDQEKSKNQLQSSEEQDGPHNSDSEAADLAIDGITESFIGEEQLNDFDPKGHADMVVNGTTHDAALDLDFTYEDGTITTAEGENKPSPDRSKLNDIDLPKKRHRRSASAVPEASQIPKLAVSILVCGTRGDVQPFVALGIKLKEFGHRVRIATHKDYREFVSRYDLEFYPLGGDPKVLSDFIVKHRGVFTVNAKDAIENVNQVEEVVYSSYDACTQPDPEDPDKRPFVAQAIIANPPSYGHIHVAEKMQIPCHIVFTMPWTPTRNFPHPLARIKNVRDTRPSSIAVRNYLSYLVVNEYTYTGLFAIFNSFREEKLGLDPIRFGSNGSTLLDAHNVPFIYCWSPSLVAKPADWDDKIDVTGYFFLNEGSRGKYEPSKELAAFLRNGKPPVYLGFGSLMVDDRERLTQKILDAFQETGQRLLMSRGWARLGEGFDLPDSVMLLDDVPHDWLLPQCAAAVHHGGAGTTAASLLAACPTLVIPFFGDQQFWGSAAYRRGVGPKPIPIDSLTTKKLVEALRYMEKPEVKAEAEKISAQIKSEDGVKNGVDAFHRHLPLEKLKAGKPIHWHLAKPTLGSFVHELAGGIGDIFWLPVKGARTEGVKGAIKGAGKGLFNAVARPVKGAGLAGYSVISGIPGLNHEQPKCFSTPHTKGNQEEVQKSKDKESGPSGSGEREGPDETKTETSQPEAHPDTVDPSHQSVLGEGKQSQFSRRYLFNIPHAQVLEDPAQSDVADGQLEKLSNEFVATKVE